MRITSVRINLLLPPKGSIRAFASVIFDDFLMIRDFKIIDSRRGVFVSYPSKKITDGVYREVIQSMNSDADRTIKDAIMRAYEDELARPENKIQPSAC
ncbi:MAG: septation protein SpoVG family protein [Candidatus Riflebacteria bacterium]|nr:septation protein SpoVG family protein [Candidatus Riflebacteria bacterium]